MKTLVPLLTTMRGEINQRDFWIGAAILFGVGAVANMVSYFGTMVALLLLYPWACLALKRLRNMGRPERLVAVPVLLGVLSIVASLLAGAVSVVSVALAGLLLALGGFAGLLALAFLVWLGLSRSRQVQHPAGTSNLTSRL